MGAESYFINAIFDGARPIKQNGLNAFEGITGLEVEKFSEFLLNAGLSRKDMEQYILDASIIVTLITKNEKVLAISMEGCFSWYPRGLRTMITLATKINSQCYPLKLFHPAIGMYDVSNKLEFIERIKSTYHNMFCAFKKNYSIKNVRVLPGIEFYNLVSGDAFFSKILKLFSKYRNR